ncbi:V-type ATP synthase subunit K [bacterium]|nr:V-type ATP synthase subunit K [bacterium]
MEWGFVLAILGAATAVVLSGFGSSIGIGIAGQASDGLLSEEPEKFGNILILAVLPGTQGIYGFVAAFIVMLRVGLVGGATVALTTIQGLQIFLASLPVALGGLVSGVYQGKVSAAGIAVVAKQPADSMKAVIMAALVETYAVLGLLISILLLFGIKL